MGGDREQQEQETRSPKRWHNFKMLAELFRERGMSTSRQEEAGKPIGKEKKKGRKKGEREGYFFTGPKLFLSDPNLTNS